MPGPQLANAATRAEITALAVEHAWLPDHGEYDRIAELYTHDGVFYGQAEPFVGRDAIRAWGVERRKATTLLTAHVVSNLRLVVQADGQVRGSSYLLRHARPPEVMTVLPVSVTEYDDLFRKEDGRWLFRERRATRVFVAAVP